VVTAEKPKDARGSGSDLTADQLAALDPRIREWVVNANYTVSSQLRSDYGGFVGDSVSFERRPEGVSRGSKSVRVEPPGRRSADGILIVRSGTDERERLDPELEQLKKLGMHLPIRFKERFRGFWPSPPPRTKPKRLSVDPLETYKTLQHYQMRLNSASLRTMEVQETLHKKICESETLAWSCAHQSACMGVMVNDLETHISEAWNIEKQLTQTRLGLGKAVQAIDQLLSNLHPDLRALVGDPPFQIAPQFTHAYYLKLNYLTLTSFNPTTQAIHATESKWLNNILPYWDLTIDTPSTRTLWRQGIPPRLRAYVWQRAIGNRLFLTQEMFHTYRNSTAASQATAQHSEPIYEAVQREQVSGSGTPSADGTVEIDLTDPSNRTTDPLVALTSESPSTSKSEDGALQTKIQDRPAEGDERTQSEKKQNRIHELIIRDSLRTFSKIGIFKTPKTAPHDDLVTVLHAIATLKPELGYVQGQSFLAAVLLLYMPADEAFVALGNLLDQPFFKAFSKFDLESIRVQTTAFENLLQRALPQLHEHFATIHLTPELYLFDWYVTLFAKPLAPPASGIIWDAYLMEGASFVPLVTCAILKQFASRLLLFNFEECMKLLRQLPDDFNILEAMKDVELISAQLQQQQQQQQLHQPLQQGSTQRMVPKPASYSPAPPLSPEPTPT